MKVIIFDFDGVIHDTFDYTLATLKRLTDDAVTAEELKDAFNGSVHAAKSLSPEVLQAYFKEQTEAAKAWSVEAEIETGLRSLAEKVPLYIISSNCEESLNLYFQNNDMTDVFQEVLGKQTHKSKVEKFKMLAEKLSLPMSDFIFVTDTVGDIKEAAKVDLKTIAVDFGFHDKERLEDAGPHKVMSSPAEMFQFLEGGLNS